MIRCRACRPSSPIRWTSWTWTMRTCSLATWSGRDCCGVWP